MRRRMPLVLLGVAALLLGLGQSHGWPLLHRHDKLAHAIGLALLALALRRAMPRWRLRSIALACIGAAVGLEALQLFVPGRTASWPDVAAGLLGAGLAVLALAVRAHRADIAGLRKE